MSNAQPETGPISARAGTYYRNARYLMFVIIAAFGVWFLYDGFVRYPEQNRKYAELTKQVEELERKRDRDESEYLRLTMQRKEMTHHEEFSINVQKALGFALPPIGLALMIFWIHRSRGEIRLENGILNAPGHAPIPLRAVDELDKTLWDRKGIAHVYYTLNGISGKLRLDDFIYQARPIRDIVKQIDEDLKHKDHVAVAEKPKTSAPASV